MDRLQDEENDMTKTCSVCHGELKQQLITYTQFLEGHFVVIENVPAWVCENCGETYLDPDVVDRIHRVLWSGGEPARTIATPVYDLSTVA